MAPPKGTAAVQVAEKLGLFKGATKFFRTARRLTRELPQEPKRIINRFAKGPEHELTASQRGHFSHAPPAHASGRIPRWRYAADVR
jgi:hypothetical protein